MALKDGRGLFQIHQHPRGIDCILIWLTLECFHL